MSKRVPTTNFSASWTRVDQTSDPSFYLRIMAPLVAPGPAVGIDLSATLMLAPAGLLSVGEWDWDSTCLAVTDTELGRRFTHLICDQMHNGLIARELPWQLPRHGFTQVAVTPQVRLS